jgi:antitoxin PrlF
MPASTINSKGQITVPKEVRDLLRLKAGDRVEFLIEASGKVEFRPLSNSILDLCGALHQPGMRPASIEEMDETVGRYLAEDDQRILRGGR